MSAEPEHYLAYLIRFWTEPGSLPGQWRASLEDPRTGERRGFAGLEALMGFVRDRLAAEAAGPRPPEGG